MLKQMVAEELNILEELIKNADIQYLGVLDMGGIVSHDHFEYMNYLGLRKKYLQLVLANINTNEIQMIFLNAPNKE